MEDPDGEKEQILSEMADKTLPALQMYQMAKAKLAKGLEIEAQLIARQLGLTLEQLRTGNLGKTSPPAVKEEPTRPMIPLMGGGKAGGMITPARSRGSEAEEQPPEQTMEEEV